MGIVYIPVYGVCVSITYSRYCLYRLLSIIIILNKCL
nr:MAG TPA: hypothetical protein [Crassvirales sp.]